MRIGNNTGASLITTTNTPLKFSTYTSDVDLTNNRPSIEIGGSGSRDVTIVSNFTVKGSLNTFENDLFIARTN